jgi:hypothetical protein
MLSNSLSLYYEYVNMHSFHAHNFMFFTIYTPTSDRDIQLYKAEK